MRLLRWLCTCSMSSIPLRAHHRNTLDIGYRVRCLLQITANEHNHINRRDVLRVHAVVLHLEIDHVAVANQELVAPIRPLHNARVGLANWLSARITNLLGRDYLHEIRLCRPSSASTSNESALRHGTRVSSLPARQSPPLQSICFYRTALTRFRTQPAGATSMSTP